MDVVHRVLKATENPVLPGPSRCRRTTVWLWGALAACATVASTGCGKPVIQARPGVLAQAPPYLYTDQDWALVLRDYVHNGLVDYDALSRNRDPLERYYALLGVTGPTRTPDQFPSSNHITAYWIDAYNALVLLAVLQRYPVETMYDLSLPRPETEYAFQVDGRVMNLAAIEEEMLKASGGDARVLLATSRAAMGTPRLPGEPMRSASLERQLSTAAADALGNSRLLRIDHSTRSIFVWQLILTREKDFVDYWRSRRRAQTGYLFNVLLDLASPERRRSLQSAVGYMFRPMPFDRALNKVPSAGGIRPQVP